MSSEMSTSTQAHSTTQSSPTAKRSSWIDGLPGHTATLALTYVQKARYAEAILLYQRSIELFTSDKDKAISWNRLGNVYRRMDDYDNAICAYQRADDLDPDNTTLSLQSRFSLLGSYVLEQKPSYAS